MLRLQLAGLSIEDQRDKLSRLLAALIEDNQAMFASIVEEIHGLERAGEPDGQALRNRLRAMLANTKGMGVYAINQSYMDEFDCQNSPCVYLLFPDLFDDDEEEEEEQP